MKITPDSQPYHTCMFSFTFFLHEQTKKKGCKLLYDMLYNLYCFFIFNTLKLYGFLKSYQDSFKKKGIDITCIDICHKHVQQSMQNSIV